MVLHVASTWLVTAVVICYIHIHIPTFLPIIQQTRTSTETIVGSVRCPHKFSVNILISHPYGDLLLSSGSLGYSYPRPLVHLETQITLEWFMGTVQKQRGEFTIGNYMRDQMRSILMYPDHHLGTSHSSSFSSPINHPTIQNPLV
jgi:hypothetical protein